MRDVALQNRTPWAGGGEGQAEAVQGERQLRSPGVLVTFPWHRATCRHQLSSILCFTFLGCFPNRQSILVLLSSETERAFLARFDSVGSRDYLV